MDNEAEGEISLCKSCYCMTHTIDGKCGKCTASKILLKPDSSSLVSSNEAEDVERELSERLKHTLKLVPSSQRETFVFELARFVVADRKAQRQDERHRLLAEIEGKVNEESYPHIDHDVFRDKLIDIISGGGLSRSNESVTKADMIIAAWRTVLKEIRTND